MVFEHGRFSQIWSHNCVIHIMPHSSFRIQLHVFMYICIDAYNTYKDPVARQKHQQQIESEPKKGSYLDCIQT